MNVKVQSVRHVENRAVVVFSDSQTGEAFGLEADAVLLATGANPIRKILIWKLPEWRRTHVERSLWMNI